MADSITTPCWTPRTRRSSARCGPRRLDDFVGQERIKEQLGIALDAAKGRDEALDHVLLAGPPGLGKTTLAQIIREELGVGLRTVAGPALEKKDIAAILTAIEPRDVLFIDEIHRLNRAAEEILYPALEDFRLDIVFGQGAAARTLTIDLPPFTLVGATTRSGLLTTPLRDRFGMTFRLGYYEPAQLGTIVRRSAGILDVEIDDDAADEIASRSRGTPRIANRILRRVRDVAEVRHAGKITNDVAREALELLEVDGVGLERIDRELLSAVAEQVRRRPGRPLDARRRARRGDRTRSRTSTSRTCSSSASSSARRAAGSSPTSAAKHVGAVRVDGSLFYPMPELWTPGTAGPLDELVKRIERRIEGFVPSTGSSEPASASSSSTARCTGSRRSRPSRASGSSRSARTATRASRRS